MKNIVKFPERIGNELLEELGKGEKKLLIS